MERDLRAGILECMFCCSCSFHWYTNCVTNVLFHKEGTYFTGNDLVTFLYRKLVISAYDRPLVSPNMIIIIEMNYFSAILYAPRDV